MTCTLTQAALSRVLPRYDAAFGRPRHHWLAGTTIVPLPIEQCAAITAGATTLQLDESGRSALALVNGDFLYLDGNRFALQKAMLKPEEVVVACGRTSRHFNVANVLAELEIATGVVAARWHITVAPGGKADVDIAPSAAYVAEELRARPVTDVLSVSVDFS